MRNRTRERTKAAVFLLESNTLSDEKLGDSEGEVLSKILHLSRVKTKYFYFRTKREFKMLLKEFQGSAFRYLHVACHGDEKGMATTFDELSFSELSEVLAPYINHRRVFFSACAMVNTSLARQLFRESECFSIMGPANDIYFGDAAVFWASFYTVLLRHKASSMSRERIVSNARVLADAFSIDLNYFGRKSNTKFRPYTFTRIRGA